MKNQILKIILLFLSSIHVNGQCDLFLQVESAGMDDGNFVNMSINGQALSGIPQTRGFIVHEIDAITGQSLQTQSFDTNDQYQRVQDFILYINNLEPSKIVILGIFDEATYRMTDEAFLAMEKIGLTANLRIGYRDSYALIGGKDLKARGQSINQLKQVGSGKATISKCVREQLPAQCSNYISVVSGGQMDSKTFGFAINYQRQPLPNYMSLDRGLYVIVLDRDDATIIKEFQKFDTQISSIDNNNFNNLIANLPNGEHIIIGAMDTVDQYLTSNFSTSIESIGGPSNLNIGFQESFAIIGKKGDPLGSATWDKNIRGGGGVLIRQCVEGCNYKCSTCSGHKDNCDSCSNRLNIQADCSCATQFYEQSETTCSPCLNKCAECINGIECTICASGIGRSGLSPKCDCLSGYFDNGQNQINCQECQYPCNNCEGSSTSCTNCSTVENRKDENTCQCSDNFYDNNIECVQCNYPCLNCQNNADSCLGCLTSDNRISNTDCRCLPNFYETGSSCEKCQYPCLNCSGSANQCDSCVEDDNRSSLHPCFCNSGYFDNGENCQKCHYKCNECIDYTTCKPNSCSNQTRDQANNCLCLEGYFDTGISKCAKCSYKCKKCSGNADNCITCAIGVGRTLSLAPKCECMQNYFDDGNLNADCLACVHPCIDCQSLTICNSCVERDFAEDASKCTCLQGYYENSNLQCEICQKQCKSCQNTNKHCTICITGENRYDIPNCTCKDGFYEDLNQICQPCVYPCLKCISQTICIECQTTDNRFLPDINNKSCDCLLGYYDTGIFCDKCEIQCQTCISKSYLCLQCSVQSRYGEFCICKEGYYDIGVTDCQKCDNKCGTCKNSDSNCLTCSSIDRDIMNNCQCKQGFFEDDNQNICQPCQYPCVNCFNQTVCLSCFHFEIELPQSRKTIPNCHCSKGYFENRETLVCEKCHSRCQQCQDFSTNCTVCNNTHTRKSVKEGCQCKENKFFIVTKNDIEICEPCNENCLQCNEIGICLLCLNKNALPPQCQELIEDDRGFLTSGVIIQGQYTQITKVCEIQCQKCQNEINNCISCNKGLNRTMQPPLCECQKGYYGNQLHRDCRKCQENCAQCIDFNQCVQCKEQIGRVLDFETGYCVCKRGFKEIQGECVQCFQYHQDCLQVCPKNTVQDLKTYSCNDIFFTQKSNDLIIILCACLVIFIMILGKVFFIVLLKTLFNNYKSNNPKNIIENNKLNSDHIQINIQRNQQNKINLNNLPKSISNSNSDSNSSQKI